jgi:hypothetical protein
MFLSILFSVCCSAKRKIDFEIIIQVLQKFKKDFVNLIQCFHPFLVCCSETKKISIQGKEQPKSNLTLFNLFKLARCVC